MRLRVTRWRLTLEFANCENCDWRSVNPNYGLRGAKRHAARTGHRVLVEHTRSTTIERAGPADQRERAPTQPGAEKVEKRLEESDIGTDEQTA